MPTRNQIEAARRNGAKSHGPITPEGKARVSQNGIKHGIYANIVVLENEDPDLYNSWRDNHLAEWAPATDTELNLVIDLVDARWRLRRLSVLETKALDFEIGRMRQEIDKTFSKDLDEGFRTVFGLTSLVSLNRTYEVIQTSIRSQHRIIDRCTAQLLKLGKYRRPLGPDSSDDRDNNDDHGGRGPASDTGTGPRNTAEPPAEAEGLSGAHSSTTPPQNANAHANSEDQTREGAAVATTASTTQERQNRESKPEPVSTDTPSHPRARFDPTIDTRGRAHPSRLRAA